MASQFLRVIPLVLILISSAGIACGQEGADQSSDEPWGSWTIPSLKVNITDSWSATASVQIRKDGVIYDLNQILMRAAVNYKIDKKNSVSIAYSTVIFRELEPDGSTDIFNREHRLHQQFTTKHHIDRVYFKHRYRFEQRFFKEDFDLRVRYLLELQVPINNKEVTDKTVYAVTNNEILLNTKNDIFNSNRFFAGLGYKVNPTVGFQLGYMHIAQSSYRVNNLKTKISITI